MTIKHLAAALLAAGVALGLSSAAPAEAAGPRIGPNQLFDGFVNGHRPNAVIMMACFGPIRPGQTGHPTGGQTLSVQLSVDVPGGNTGASAHKIVAIIGTSSATLTAVTFRRYGTKALPTSLTLPCAGSGQVTFDPEPSSPTSRPDIVHVTFVGQP